MNSTIRRIHRGDTSVFLEHRELLDDPHAILLVAFDGNEEVGFVLDDFDLVDEELTGRLAVAAAQVVRDLAELGIRDAFVLTEPDNEAANRLYERAGGTRSDVVMWDVELGAERKS